MCEPIDPTASLLEVHVTDTTDRESAECEDQDGLLREVDGLFVAVNYLKEDGGPERV
jgi:hypothetical protein